MTRPPARPPAAPYPGAWPPPLDDGSARAVAGRTPAGYGRRIAAWLVDLAVAVAAGGWIALLASPVAALWLASAGAVALVAVVQWVLHGRLGASLGRLALGVRTVDAESGRPIGMARVLLRGLVVLAGGLVVGIGAFVVLASPLVDPTGRRRGWHDRAVRAEVVRAGARSATDGSGTEVDDPFGPAYDRVTAGHGERGDDAWSVAASATPVPAGWPWRVASEGERPPRPWSAPANAEVPTVTGSLRLAPIAPQRSGPDLDTRAIPVVPGLRPADPPLPPAVREPEPVPPALEPLAAPVVGSALPAPADLDPALELTHRAVPRDDLVADETVPVTGPETAEIELSDGRRLLVERTALIGRNPVSRADVRTIRVHDPGRSVSKTHLQLGVEPGGVWVADRGSTNGTVVTLPGGDQVLCGVDQRVRLRVGAVVVFGDCALRLVRGPSSPAVP